MIWKKLSTTALVLAAFGLFGIAPAAASASSPSSYRLEGAPKLLTTSSSAGGEAYVIFRTAGGVPQSGSCVGSDACLVVVRAHGNRGRTHHAPGRLCYRAALGTHSSTRLIAGHRYQVSFLVRDRASGPLRTVTRRKLTAHSVRPGAVTSIGCSKADSSPTGRGVVGHRLRVRHRVSVDRRPNQLYIGRLSQGESFKVRRLSPSGKYAYGLAYGHVDQTGWIRTSALGDVATVGCSKSG